ncbi:MAG: hypothetical protein AAFY65_08815 [Pseudomonadota bacterium]
MPNKEVLSFCALMLLSGPALAQDFALTEGAPAGVMSDLASGGAIDRVRSWSGNVDGQGGPDLIVQVAYATGGNSVNLQHFVYGGSPLRRTHELSLDQAGIAAVRRVGGQVEIIKNVYRSGDRRCCPTGREAVRFSF